MIPRDLSRDFVIPRNLSRDFVIPRDVSGDCEIFQCNWEYSSAIGRAQLEGKEVMLSNPTCDHFFKITMILFGINYRRFQMLMVN